MGEAKEAVIVSAARTPIGKYGGMLASLEGYQLRGLVAKSESARNSLYRYIDRYD